MKATLDVKDRREADAIRSGLEDPAVRAYVVVMGVLSELPTQRAKRRVLQYVADLLDERDEMKETATPEMARGPTGTDGPSGTNGQ